MSVTRGGVNVNAASLAPLTPAGVLQHQGNNPYWLWVAGSILYVAVTNDRCVKAYDISNPSQPTLVATSATFGAGFSIGYIWSDGVSVFVTDTGGISLALYALKAASAANLLAGTALAQIAGPIVYNTGGTGGGRFDVDTTANLLCVGGPENGANAQEASIIDVSNPAAPVLKGTTVATGSTHRGVAAIGASKFALCSRDNHTVYIVDATTPTAPTIAGSVATTLGTLTTPCKYVGNGLLLVCDYGSAGFTNSRFYVIDVSNPAAPAIKGSVAVLANSEQIAVRGNLAYLGERASAAISAVDFSAPTAPVVKGSQGAQNGGTITPGVAVDPTGAYVYQTAAGLTTNGMIQLWATASGLGGLAGQLAALVAAGVLS